MTAHNRPLDENALAHTINMMPWRTDDIGPKLREFAYQLWLQFCSVQAAATAPASTQDEPFGYFRADPMGWTDCAADDEGAIALYERPAAPAVPQGCGDGVRVLSPDPMTHEKAAYFIRRFKQEEKLLGPNEQAAIDFVLTMLAAAPAAPSQEPAVNLSCRSTQARLAAQWGYVPAPSQPAVPEWPESLSLADIPEFLSKSDVLDLQAAINRAAVAEANLIQIKSYARVLRTMLTSAPSQPAVPSVLKRGYGRLIQAAADLALQQFMPSDIVDDYPSKTISAAKVAKMMTQPRDRLRLLSIEVSEGAKQMLAAAPSQGTAELGDLEKRAIFDAIRCAYDLGYNDARNAHTVPGDSAPRYKGRDVEADHGGALITRLNQLSKPSQEPVTLTDRQFDLICQAIDKADTITMDGDYMMDSGDCIAVVRVMQALFGIAALREKQGGV